MTKALMLIAVVALIASDPAMAAANLHDATGTYEGLLDLVKDTSNKWHGRLLGYATNLFWFLTIISMIWQFGHLALKQPQFSDVVAELIRFSATTAVFYTLMVHSADIGSAIINSFRQAGAHAAGVGTGLRPGEMFGMGVEIAKTLTVPTLNPALMFISGIAGLMILLCFAFIAAFMGITLIEAYVVINLAVLLMGFGGAQWTRDYAIAMWRASLAVGVKLLVMTILVGLTMVTVREWQMRYTQDDTSTFTLLGIAFVLCCMVKIVPDMMGSLISGVSPGGGGVIGGMAAAGMAFGAGVAATLASKMGPGGMLGGLGQQLGGVADLLRGSGSGGSSSGGSSRGGASFMNSMASSGSGGASAMPGSRVGGGGRTHSAPPSSSGPSASSPSPSSGGTPQSGGGMGSKVHAAADMAVRTMGAAVATAVPGAESAHSVSIGSPPTPPDLGVDDTPENIIRPASESPSIRTMADLNESLNNQGKKA